MGRNSVGTGEEEMEAWEEEDDDCDDYDGVEVLDKNGELPSLRQAGSGGGWGGGKIRAGQAFPCFAPPTV
jgi:hypothetical protein